MNNVDRWRIKQAASRIIADPSLLDHISEGPKLKHLRHELNNYKHGRSTITDVENALAWSLGFNVIEG